MYDSGVGGRAGGVTTSPALTSALVRSWCQALTAAGTADDADDADGADGVDGVEDAERIDLLRALEGLKCAAAGVQAVTSARFEVSQRVGQAAAGVPSSRRGRGVGAQVGLARRESPHRGARYLGLAKVLVNEMPQTLAVLVAGRISEWRATLIVQGTACLSREHRAVVDDRLAGTAERVRALEAMGERRLVATLLGWAQELDVEALVERRRQAEAARRVSGRAAPDTMMYLTALLSARDGVGALAALHQVAAAAVAAGDPRTRDQIMADTLVARLTGREPVTGSTPVTIDLVITDTTLLDPDNTDDTDDTAADESEATDPDDDDYTEVDGAEVDADEAGAGVGSGGVAFFGPSGSARSESGYLHGYGPVPAELAREIAAQALIGDAAPVYLRRLYAHPVTGQLVAMESRQRLFPAGLAHLIRLRDQICRTPWCNAPIRHIDHVVPHADGGPTSATNGQGLCAACNHAKQAPGWRAGPAPGDRHTITLTTPTGHTYTSTAPPPTG